MSIDLQEIFDAAGRQAPPPRIDVDVVVRRGRRARSRRRAVLGVSGVLGAAAVAVTAGAATTGLPVSWTAPFAPSAPGPAAPGLSSPAIPSPTRTDPATDPTSPATREALAQIGLPDPAPGFPVRRWKDTVGLSEEGAGRPDRWVALFGLAVRPGIATRDDSGVITGGRPDGPEVTLMVGEGLPPALTSDDTVTDRTAAVEVPVAGVTGTVVTYQEKGQPCRVLTFDTGRFWVQVHGFGDVSTPELVALGNALTGLR